jgi:hypothetical protein
MVNLLDRYAAFTVYCALTNNMPLAILCYPVILLGMWRLSHMESEETKRR